MGVCSICLMDYLHAKINQNPKPNNKIDIIPDTTANNFAFCPSSVSVMIAAIAPKKQEAAKASTMTIPIILSI